MWCPLPQKVKDDATPQQHIPGVHILRLKWWTVLADAISSTVENYQALQMTWDDTTERLHSELRACAGGIAAQMEKSASSFGAELGRKILNTADNLSLSLQENPFQHVRDKHLSLNNCNIPIHPLWRHNRISNAKKWQRKGERRVSMRQGCSCRYGVKKDSESAAGCSTEQYHLLSDCQRPCNT